MHVPPQPPVGHVIAYEFLWASQADMREDGAKVYPCVVVVAAAVAGDRTIAYVLGISHSAPRAGQRAMALPKRLKRYLGLDDDPSWVYTDEINAFVWPGPDLRPGSHVSSRPAAAESCMIAPLPSDWFKMVTDELLESRRLGRLRVGRRSQ